jgi:hypothetical protein
MSQDTLVVSAEPVETLETPTVAQVFTIIATAAALGAAIAAVAS